MKMLVFYIYFTPKSQIVSPIQNKNLEKFAALLSAQTYLTSRVK